jgi:hypothetical protein
MISKMTALSSGLIMVFGLPVVKRATQTAMQSLFWAGMARLVTLANCSFSTLGNLLSFASAIDTFTFRLVYGIGTTSRHGGVIN